MPTLIIFVDALGYAQLERLPRLSCWSYRARLKPGFGYSINIHPELFSGLTPDEVGFFGEWTVDPSRAPALKYRRLLPLLDRLFRPYFLNRGLQTVLTARYGRGHIMPNIPLARLGDFAIRGVKVSSPDYTHPSIFSEFPDLVAIRSAGVPKGQRDATLVAQARDYVEGGARQLYLPLPDLDGIGHAHSTSSAEWSIHLGNIDNWVSELAQAFLGLHRDGDVFVVSDHGMADVDAGVAFDLESEVGAAQSGRYLYFTDSTLVRVWIDDPALGPPIADYFARSRVASLVTHEERVEYGLTNPAFGDFIAVLGEGLCFKPSTFARNIPAAMHGYHPEVESQHATLLHYGAHPPSSAPARTVDVFGALTESLRQ